MRLLDRRFRRGLLALVGLLALGSAGLASAAPLDVTRAADGELGFCREGYVCTARAVGDFNGDKIDDLVFEVATREAMVEQLRFSAFNVPTERVFELHLGPFRAQGASQPGLPADMVAAQVVHLSLATAQSVDVLRAHDMDGDGREELVFAQLPEAALLILRGQRNWKPYYRLDRGSQDILTIDLAGLDERLFMNADGRFMQPIGLASAVADVNGDGRPDLIIGRDLGDARSAAQRQADAFVLPGTGLWSDFERFAWSTHIVGIGGCIQGLAGAADVTGDGLADIVLRRCVSANQPTELRVLPGRQDWPGMLSAENQPDIVPPPVPSPPPGGGGGGGYLPSRPESPLVMPQQVLIEDIDGDGLVDIGIEFAGKTHVYHGGADIVARARANRSSGALQKLGLGAMPLTNSWKLMDLNGDDSRDLLLSQSIDPSLLACPSGGCGASVRPLSSQPIYGFTGDQRHSAVLDPRLDAPDLLWQSSGSVAWGSGDFNGDGLDDLLLGSAPGAYDSIYSFVNGPILSRFSAEDGRSRSVLPGLPASGVAR